MAAHFPLAPLFHQAFPAMVRLVVRNQISYHWQPLPCLPLWLTEDLAVPLDLEASYEQTCRDLRVA